MAMSTKAPAANASNTPIPMGARVAAPLGLAPVGRESGRGSTVAPLSGLAGTWVEAETTASGSCEPEGGTRLVA